MTSDNSVIVDDAKVLEELESQLDNDQEFGKMRERLDIFLDGLPVVNFTETLKAIKKTKRQRRKKPSTRKKVVADKSDGGGAAADDENDDAADVDDGNAAIENVLHDYEKVGDDEYLYSIDGTLDDIIQQQAREEEKAIADAQRNLAHHLPSVGLTADKALAALRIDNIVTATKLSQPIDCAFVAVRGSCYGFGFNRKRFAATVNRHRIAVRDRNNRNFNPATTTTDATTMTFPTGKIITTGAKRFDVAVRATEKTCGFIREMHGDNGSLPYANLRPTEIRIKNVVASTSLFFKIDVQQLQERNPDFVRYEDDEWIGAIMQLNCMSSKYANRCVTILAFGPGTLVFTGTNGYADCVSILVDVFPYLCACAISDVSDRSIVSSSLTRLAPPTQPEIVPASSRKRKQPSASLTARNIIALDTMMQHEKRKSDAVESDAKRRQLLEDLRSNSKNLTSSSKRTELRTKPMEQYEALGMAHETPDN